MKNDDHHDLIAELEKSRVTLGESLGQAAETLDVPARVVRTLREQPRWVYWAGGAVLVGAVLLRVVPRRRYYAHPAIVPTATSRTLTVFGVLLGAAKIAFPIVRPALTAYAAKAIAQITKKR